jgi:hypothetical protein
MRYEGFSVVAQDLRKTMQKREGINPFFILGGLQKYIVLYFFCRPQFPRFVKVGGPFYRSDKSARRGPEIVLYPRVIYSLALFQHDPAMEADRPITNTCK